MKISKNALSPTPITTIKIPNNLYIKRLDLTHPQIIGNKWYKLKYNLELAKSKKIKHLVTFGGAYSNHILATAWAGKLYGFKTTAFVRGELTLPLNPVLQKAKNLGMTLLYIDRKTYSQKDQSHILEQLIFPLKPCYVLPEGGTNNLAIKGCQEIISEINKQLKHYSYICTPVGTAGTFLGLASGIRKDSKLIGFSALKNAFSLEGKVNDYFFSQNLQIPNWQIIHDYHFGGFAKRPNKLKYFANKFQKDYNIALDLTYTAKMFAGIFDLVKKKYFKKSDSIVALHTGGIW